MINNQKEKKSLIQKKKKKSKSKRALENRDPVEQLLIITRYNPERVQNDDMLSKEDIQDTLSLPIIGIIPDSNEVLNSINVGKPVILGDGPAAGAYDDLVRRFLGEKQLPFRFIDVPQKGFFQRLFNR